MKKIEIIKDILLNTKFCINLKNETDELFEKIESFSIKHPEIFEDIIDKKIEQFSSAAQLFPTMFTNTEDLMKKAFVVYIKEFDEL